MHHLTDILRFATIGCLVLVAVQLWRSSTPRRQALPAAGFCTGVLCYLLVDWEPMRVYPTFFLFLAPAFGTPVFFWMFSKSLFDDGFVLKKWMAGAVGAVVLFFYIAFFINWMDGFGLSTAINTIVGISQQAVALLFAILAIVEASRGRSADLILPRLEFRTVFILLSAVLMVLTVMAEIAFRGGNAPGWLDFLQKMIIAALAYYFAIQRLEFKRGFFLENEAPEAAPPKPEVDKALLNQLLDLVEGHHYYRTEGLTIRQLAEKMEVKEHKLRQTINQHLGFRNFNDFLNSYRIAEACRLLSDPQQREVTVLEIAYELGYNSLAPFNKAFKEITGMTPTEWRKKG